MTFVPRDPINNIPALFQIMAWRRPGYMPLSETMLVTLLTHICVIRPQWVNAYIHRNPNKYISYWGHRDTNNLLSLEFWFLTTILWILCWLIYWDKLQDALQLRHNDHDGVSNHQAHGCLLDRLFRRRSKKTSKLRVTGLCVGNSPGLVNSPHKGPVTRKMLPFDDVIMEMGSLSSL